MLASTTFWGLSPDEWQIAATIVTAVATLCLAVITFWYATVTRRLAEHTGRSAAADELGTEVARAQATLAAAPILVATWKSSQDGLDIFVRNEGTVRAYSIAVSAYWREALLGSQSVTQLAPNSGPRALKVVTTEVAAIRASRGSGLELRCDYVGPTGERFTSARIVRGYETSISVTTESGVSLRMSDVIGEGEPS